MNTVLIDKHYCKGCNLCIAVCKVEALSKGSERNAKGYIVPVHDSSLCVACTFCEMTCPEMVITVSKGEKKNA